PLRASSKTEGIPGPATSLSQAVGWGMAKISVVCTNPTCDGAFLTDEENVGQMVRCKRCKMPFIVARNIWKKGEVILGEFEVEGRLGRGGMGVVYCVRKQSTGQRYAVKKTVCRDEATRRDFLAELRTWSELPEHPNLVH